MAWSNFLPPPDRWGGLPPPDRWGMGGWREGAEGPSERGASNEEPLSEIAAGVGRDKGFSHAYLSHCDEESGVWARGRAFCKGY